MSSHPDVDADAGAAFRRRGTVDGRTATGESDDVPVTEPSREEVFQTVFGLGPQAVRTYDAVVAGPGSTTRELAAVLDRDRSNVNRSLNRLRETGLATRERRILDDGGHVYQYYAGADVSPDGRIVEAVDEWCSAALDAVKRD